MPTLDEYGFAPMGLARMAHREGAGMAETDAVRRGEAFLALLRRLRERPLLPVPGAPESEAELYARVDRPGRAALLSEDQYTLILRSSRVAWRSVLAFITQEPDGSSTRTFWIDPHRLTRFGCLLSEEDIDVAGPLFGLDRAQRGPISQRSTSPRSSAASIRSKSAAGSSSRTARPARSPNGSLWTWQWSRSAWIPIPCFPSLDSSRRGRRSTPLRSRSRGDPRGRPRSGRG